MDKLSCLDVRHGSALLLAQAMAASPEGPGVAGEPAPRKLVSIGQLDLSSVDPGTVRLEAKNLEDNMSQVELDRDGRVLVEEGFSGEITLIVGERRAVITVKIARPVAVLPIVPRIPADSIAAAAYPMMMCAHLTSDTPSRPSSKRGARAASGDKPWQVRSWRGAGTRPRRR